MTAHRCILSGRSPYFKTLLSGRFREGKPGEIVKIGDTTHAAFHAILLYLYTDRLNFSDDEVINVMRKAKEIEIERVYNYCTRHCFRAVKEQNVVIWLVQAHMYGLEELRAVTLGYLTRNFRRVRSEAGATLNLLQEHPAIMLEVMMNAL